MENGTEKKKVILCAIYPQGGEEAEEGPGRHGCFSGVCDSLERRNAQCSRNEPLR